MAEQKKFYRYHEGLCSTKDVVKELAKVLSIGVRSQEVKDSDGNPLLESFILKSKNWDIVYPKPDSSITGEDYKEKILNQINQISDTVILKTKTTEVEVAKNKDDLADEDSNKEYLEMYLEIYKPTYIANPEEYPLDCERQGIVPKVITKSMHEEALSTKRHGQETVTVNGNGTCTMTNTISTLKAVPEYGTAQMRTIIAKINKIYGEEAAGELGFTLPTTIIGEGTPEIVFDKTRILSIKANDNELYTIIKENLKIDDNTFKNFSELKFKVGYIAKDTYMLSIEANTTTSIYTLNTSTSYILKETGALLAPIVPEYYVDGAYIPMDKSLWMYDASVEGNRAIKFTKEIIGDTSKDGHVVIRYEVQKQAHEDVYERTFVLNNHYVLMRLYDGLNDTGDGPSETIYNDKGEVVLQKAHVSDWCKLSWYRDFEEVLRDEVDADVDIGTIADGTLLVPLQTAGLNGETKIRYWINTNNDRFNLIVMGNPSLDYQRERHLISACYCGKIDSFDHSINDTAGNFALFTSSSTEPCKSELIKEKTYDIIEYRGDDYTSPEFKTFLSKAYRDKCKEGVTEYYVQLPEGRYFNQELFPSYIVLKNGEPLDEGMNSTVANIEYQDKDQALVKLYHAYDEDCEFYLGYPYYEEKVVLTSGVERDMFGNVVNVKKTDTFGANTSDGTTSVMMYHTQTKTYYQKHHMMFTTTEEYMSKVLYGKSLYTNEYYADRIKITHANDGPRGMLNDMLVIDSSSLYPFDELVINKDFEKNPEEFEETYVYFPVSAPYSPLSDSPNARYGIAIKKNEVEPSYADEKKIVEIALDELQLLAKESWDGISNNIYPLSQTTNGSTVLWSIVDGSQWIEDVTNLTDYEAIRLAVIANETLKGNKEVPLVAKEVNVDALTPVDDFEGSKFISEVTFDVTGFTPETAENKVYYGVVKEVPEINEDAVIKITITTEATDDEESQTYEYGVEGVPFDDVITEDATQILKLSNARPGNKLIVYEVEEGEEKSLIKSFGTCELTQDMLKYPCEVRIGIAVGLGEIITEPITVLNYGTNYKAIVAPNLGAEIEKVDIVDSDGTTSTLTKDDLTESNGQYTITLNNVTRNTDITVSFTSGSL